MGRMGLILFVLLLSAITNQESDVNNGEVHFIIPKDYRDVVPVPSSGGPLIVDLELLVWTIIEVSAPRLDIEIDLYINFAWRDESIQIQSTVSKKNFVRVNKDEASRLWRPYVVFRNCKGCDPLDLDPKKNDINLDKTTEKLHIGVRSMTRFLCPIDLRSYPMDKQDCKIQLVNYFEDTKTLFFNHIYDTRHRKVLSGHVLSEYAVSDISQGNCTWAIHSGEILSCVELEIHLVRRMGHYVISIYAPTFLIVVLSWISFWLPAENPPARITLGVTSLLTLATRLDQAQKNLPPVSYVKAIDIWMIACLFLVFSSLVEFAVVHSMWRKGIKNNSVSTGSITRITTVNGKEISSTTTPSGPANSLTPIQQKSLLIDTVCRYLFPSMFFIFNCAYWGRYL